MDNASNNKHKPRTSFNEANSSREGTSTGSQWQEGNRRDHSKNRDRIRDDEWNCDRSYHNKNRDSSHDDETFREEQAPTQSLQQPTSFPAYNYSAADHSYVDNNRRALSMMCYNTLASMNVPWNQMDAMSMNTNPPAMPMPSSMDMVPGSNSAMNPYAFMGMPTEGMYGVVGMGNYCQYGIMGATENMMFPPIKEVLQLAKSVLYPPNPNAPRPTTRGKPIGCKTVFIGGLPEKATEEIIKEVFDRCGTVETIRMSKKNFCHVRFSNEMFVENAIYFSGYRIKIENKDEPPYTGRLHVDYAQARDDQYDYECKQRSLQRQARHQEQDYYRSVTPPVVHFTEHEATVVVENLRSEDKFALASHTLITWLERGECSKRNAGVFYSMLQSTNNRTRQIQVDKVKDEEVLNDAKKLMKTHYEMYLKQLNFILKIHKSVAVQKNWDQFTKAQRKNIDVWRKQAEEMRNAQVEEVINEREDEEMELSEDENDESKKNAETFTEQLKNELEEEVHKLSEEGDSLRCQLEALRNELAVMLSDHKEEIKRRDNQLVTLRQALQNSKKEVLNLSQKRLKEEAQLKELRALKRRRDDDDDNDADLHDSGDIGLGISTTTGSSLILENEARLIGLISTFLHVHPFGANIDYICSYLHQTDSTVKTRDVETLMKRFPSIYREDSTGIGASLGKKWYFTGFRN